MKDTNETTSRGSILVVDDTVENLKLLSSMLGDQGFEVRPVPSGKLALQAVANMVPDLVLLDINMPDMSGFEVCEQLKAKEKTRDIPVIFISALKETLDKVRAFNAGGVDYVTKPFQLEEVKARVETHLALRKAQTELKTNYTKLQELEKLRDDLVHMVVHDMRSPLTAILGSLELMKITLGARLEKSDRENIDSTHLGASRLLRMTNDLLEVNRLEEGSYPLKMEKHRIDELAKSAIDNVKGMAIFRTIQLVAPDSIAVDCDENSVQRIIENLVSNGIKHTPRETALMVLVSKEKDQVLVQIRDEGSGIPEEYHEKIFKKFGTLEARKERQYYSAGLGLAFCKLAVEAHGGAIGVRNVEGKGCEFWFTLPL